MKLLLNILPILLATTAYGYVANAPTTETAPAAVRIGRSRSPFDPLHVEVEAFGEVHNLRLLPAPSPLAVDFKLLTADQDEDGILIIQDVEEDTTVSDLFHDPDTGAVVSVEGDKIEGVITPSLSVKINEDGNHEAIKQYSPVPEEIIADYIEVPMEVRRGEPPIVSVNDKRSAVSANPELFVIVDSTLKAKLGNPYKVKKYLSIFWNGVNQRFSTISDPKISLIISGAIVISKSASEPFINNNKLIKDYINGEKTLESVSDWLYQKKGGLKKYDLAYLMTGKDMADVENGMIKEGLAGIAWRGAACLVADANKRSFNTGMGEDDGFYSGVMTAAHELAHNLGSPHDGSNGAENCSWDEGYIMSYVSGNPNKLFFSSCSQDLMKDYISSSDGECLRKNTLGSKVPISSQLPGELMTLDEQCQRVTGKDNAFASKSADDDSLCVQLECQWQVREGYSIWTYTQSTGRPAAEGSACKNGGKCTDGSCQ